ncbi:MAG: zinc ribbon domain-containing protein [Aigarchaeota archaeon]|nr:zinc ribbon domain-containing protein [Aigarchaeota archaeon]MCX8192823.1 zinc ribbon domain-containing protein [Nitrososphaeria archaeon]MDW7986067.1 zinc ribbon domain-containing protein [Nitrososphaerota archaeon]
MTPLMIIGMTLSLLGVALILGLVVYYVSLPVDNSIRIFLDTAVMGFSYLIYAIIIGAVISGIGLLLYVRAVRTGITITSGSYAYPAPTPVIRRPSPRREPQKLTTERVSGPVELSKESVVEEIEKEIEEIIETGAKPTVEKKVEKPVEKEPTIEVVSRASELVCPHCGKLNPVGSNKCEACGKRIFAPDVPSKSCPVCNAPLKLSQQISGDLFVCGICFSELRIPPKLQEVLNLK